MLVLLMCFASDHGFSFDSMLQCLNHTTGPKACMNYTHSKAFQRRQSKSLHISNGSLQTGSENILS